MDFTSFYQDTGFCIPAYGHIKVHPFPLDPLKRVLRASDLLSQGK